MQTNRSNVGALLGGALLIACGLLTLASQTFHNVDWGLLGTLTIIGFGALLFVLMFASGKSAAVLAIPGSIVGGVGLVLLIQNITHHWQSMAYFWTLIILFVGVGIYLMGWYSGDANQKRSGVNTMKVGVILFVIFGALFEMIFSSFNNILFPFLLILLGVYLIISRFGLFGTRKQNEPENRPLPLQN
jgi:hypothetical protein